MSLRQRWGSRSDPSPRSLARLRSRFEHDPEFQTKFHLVMTYVWMVNMPLAVTVFLLLPGVWASASIFYLVLVSLYANFATDYGAVSAAEASSAAEDIEDDVADCN